jgi:hypothetical protein
MPEYTVWHPPDKRRGRLKWILSPSSKIPTSPWYWSRHQIVLPFITGAVREWSMRQTHWQEQFLFWPRPDPVLFSPGAVSLASEMYVSFFSSISPALSGEDRLEKRAHRWAWSVREIGPGISSCSPRRWLGCSAGYTNIVVTGNLYVVHWWDSPIIHGSLAREISEKTPDRT